MMKEMVGILSIFCRCCCVIYLFCEFLYVRPFIMYLFIFVVLSVIFFMYMFVIFIRFDILDYHDSLLTPAALL